MSSACYAYFNTSLPECPDTILVRAHLTPNTQYTWSITDLHFNTPYIGQTITDADGSLTIATNAAPFPAGLFIHQAGKFELTVKRNAAQCGNSGMTLCVDELTSNIYASVVFGFYGYASNISVPAVVGCDCAAIPPDERAGDTLVVPFSNTATVTINHNLGRYVQATIYNAAGEEIFGQVTAVSLNTIQINFSQPLSGTVVID